MRRMRSALSCCVLLLAIGPQAARGDVSGSDSSGATVALSELRSAEPLRHDWYASVGFGALHVTRGRAGQSSARVAPEFLCVVGRPVATWLAVEGSFGGWLTDMKPPDGFGVVPTADGYIDWANAMPVRGLGGALALRAMYRRQAWELFARGAAGIESESVSLAGTEYVWVLLIPVPIEDRHVSGSASGLLTTLSGGVEWAPLPRSGPRSRFWSVSAVELAPRMGLEAGWRRGKRTEIRLLDTTVDPSGWFARGSFGVTLVRTGPR